MAYNTTPQQVEDFEGWRNSLSGKITIGSELLWLTREDCVRAGPDAEQTLDITRRALIAHGTQEYEMPAKIGIHPFPEVFYHAMPAYVPGMGACGMKWIECYPQNPVKYGLPQTTGLLVMNDIMSGAPVAVMDCTWLTAMRTPAVTALAAAALHPDAQTFGMFGCGVQGVEHVRFVSRTLKKLKKIYIYDTRAEAMDSLISAVKGEVSAEIIKAEPKEICSACEVMSSATIILLEPLSIVKRDWVGPGQTILPCDLNTFWEPSIQLEADRYIVDSIQEHQLFADMGYFPDGLPSIACETGMVLAGAAPGRTSADQLIVCSNIGMSVCDVAMGRYILDAALSAGLGRVLPL